MDGPLSPPANLVLSLPYVIEQRHLPPPNVTTAAADLDFEKSLIDILEEGGTRRCRRHMFQMGDVSRSTDNATCLAAFFVPCSDFFRRVRCLQMARVRNREVKSSEIIRTNMLRPTKVRQTICDNLIKIHTTLPLWCKLY